VIGELDRPDSLDQAMTHCNVVIHAAGDVSYWRRDLERQRRVNVDGTRAVLAAARRTAVERVLHISSVAAVGIPERGGAPADESHPWNAGESAIGYFLTKRHSEEDALAAHATGLDVVIVNPAYVVGPRDVRLHDGNIFVDLQQRAIPLCPPGGNCWVCVDDVVDGMLAAIARGRSGERYILGGENLSYRDAFDVVAAELGVPAPRMMLNPFIAAFAAPIYETLSFFTGRYPRMTRETARLFHENLHFDSQKAIKDLGYSYRPFRETALQTIQWYREHGILPGLVANPVS
jgi:dihydroflavonol-4-reductase